MSLRFAVVGCGAISEEMHIPTLQSCPGVELVAAVDSDAGHACVVASRFGIPAAFADMADAESIDAVVIATPPAVRPRLTAQAFALGLDVLAEKPLANSLAECEQITADCASTGRTMAVSHMFRFYPVRARMHEIVDSHGLGRVRAVEIHEGGPYSWLPRSGYTFKLGEVSGGVLANAGIHSLDSLIQWFGDPRIEFYEDDSLGGLESNVRSNLRFDGDVTASFRISRTCRLPSLFRIACEDGTLVFSNRDTVNYRIERNGEQKSFRLDDPAASPQECWKAQLLDFVESIRERRLPCVHAAEASRVVALVENMYAKKRARALPAQAPQPGLTW